MNSNISPSLVLGTTYRYEVRDVWVFVESLRRHYAGEAMLLVSGGGSRALVDYLLSRNVQPLYFDCPAWMITHVQFGRFVRYGELLRGSDHRYQQVLITEVSDVVFQGHPFDGAPEGDLLCFLEGGERTIANCPVDRNWVQSLYGPEVLARVGQGKISCSGITLGTHEAVLDYLDRLCGHVRPDRFLAVLGERGHDQGIHNVLLQTGGLPRARLIDNGRHVFTVGHVPDEEVLLEGDRIRAAKTDQICPIVHQYNYKPKLAARIAAQYPPPSEERR